MTKAPDTHRIRPKAGNAKWEHVSAEELAGITKQVGERTLKTNYQVEALAEKPAKLPTTPAASEKPEKAEADKK